MDKELLIESTKHLLEEDDYILRNVSEMFIDIIEQNNSSSKCVSLYLKGLKESKLDDLWEEYSSIEQQAEDYIKENGRENQTTKNYFDKLEKIENQINEIEKIFNFL